VGTVGARYLTDLAVVLRAAGLDVVEMDGWQDRARSSGGYDPGYPCAIYWHHTASPGNGQADAEYCTYGSDDAPVCNLVVGRDAVVWVCAGGATNTTGKGGPHTLPDGTTIPADGANSRVIGMELSNNGVGQTYPVAMIDAAFTVSLACCAAYGLPADNVVTHQVWAPDRKIDPATTVAIAGAWAPPAVTSSGTWDLNALRAECRRRAATPPPPPEDDAMALQSIVIVSGAGGQYPGAVAVTDPAFRAKTWIGLADADVFAVLGVPVVTIDGATFDRIPDVERVDPV
jgi:hypothetical protein